MMMHSTSSRGFTMDILTYWDSHIGSMFLPVFGLAIKRSRTWNWASIGWAQYFRPAPRKSMFKVTLLYYQNTTLGIRYQRQPSLPQCVCTPSLNDCFLLIAFYCIWNHKCFGLTISLDSYFGVYILFLYIKCSMHIDTYKDKLS